MTAPGPARGSIEDLLLTADRAGRYLDIHPQKLYELPIPRVKLSDRRTRWRLSDLNEFIERRTQH
ncbi:helix-turn-helix transcriptional regulator [Gemmatimonadota bacterium]|jgi:predicted DNA-binding transcriptional regulator AlpA